MLRKNQFDESQSFPIKSSISLESSTPSILFTLSKLSISSPSSSASSTPSRSSSNGSPNGSRIGSPTSIEIAYESTAADNLQKTLENEERKGKNFTVITSVSNAEIKSPALSRSMRKFLFKLNDQYYQLDGNYLYKASYVPHSPVSVENKSYNFVVIRQNGEEFLRLKEDATLSGHFGLAGGCEVLAAGEIYMHDSQIIMINPKSGSYHEKLASVNQKEIIGKYFSKEETNTFFTDVDNAEKLEKEINKRRQGNSVPAVAPSAAPQSIEQPRALSDEKAFFENNKQLNHPINASPVSDSPKKSIIDVGR